METTIVGLLAEMGLSIATGAAVEHLRAILKGDADAVQRAIRVTTRRFPEIEGAEAALRQWTSGKAFVNFFERVYAGERDLDEEIVTSFIGEGGFYFPIDEECRMHAREVIAAFVGELASALYRSDEGLVALANRQEELHVETRSDITHHMDAVLADLKTALPSLIATAVAQPESTGLGVVPDQAYLELAAKVDMARDLINQGRVHTARVNLELLRGEDRAVPEELQFRILTNLGACALADEDIDSARALLEEAHSLQPENPKGITNAAVAAHLSRDSEQAMELALRARELDTHNSQATAVLIGEFWEANENERLDELVASEGWITRDQQCGLVLAVIRAQQSRFEEAIRICRSLTEADPEDAAAHLALSQCLLNYAQADRLPVGHADESLARLHEAEAEATRAIELLRPTELMARHREAVVVRAVAFVLLGKTTEAMGDLTEVLNEAPTHSEAAFNKGLLLLSEGQPAEARAAFEGIRDPGRSADAVLPLAYACIASGDEAAAVGLLRETLTLERYSWEQVQRAELLAKAEAAVGQEDSVGPAIEMALEQDSDDPRLLALAALRCEILGDLHGAEDSLLSALKHTGDADRREVLVRLGALYQRQGRHSEAADQFVEVVDDIPWHPAAIPLLVCLVDGKRFREALDWARRIRGGHPQPPRVVIEVEAEIRDRAGDVRSALMCLEYLCSRTDSTPVDQVKLALAQFRCGERDSALETVLRINAADLRQNPRSILALAQLKLLLGQPDYLNDAYLARRYALHDPTTHLGYFAMFLGRDGDWEEPTTIGPGCAVLLKSESDNQWWHVLDEGEERLGSRELRSSDELAQRLSGKGAGDTILLREGIEDLSYEVETVQSKFVRAFQETSEEFSTRFPGNIGLSRVKVAEHDFTKVFQSVDQRDQLVREAERMYRDGRLPFSSFCSLLGRSVLEVWRGCTKNGPVPIRFGIGTAEEANEASSRLREAEGVTLDLLALLTAYELGLGEHLQGRFRRVSVPQHVVDELQRAYALTIMEPPPMGWLGKGRDGQYALTELTEADWMNWQEYIGSVLEFAESFDRIASYPLLEVDDAEMFMDTLTAAGAGAVYAGDEQSTAGLVLVSDDLGLSSIARSLRIHAVNTQAVLGDLSRSDVITPEAHSSWIEQLVLLNYWFVRVSPEDIVQRLEANNYMTTDGTRAMLKTLEGPDCSEESAVSVAANVIIALLGRAPHSQIELLLSSVVATLQHGRETSLVLLKFRDEIASRLVLAPLTRDWLIRAIDLHLQV